MTISAMHAVADRLASAAINVGYDQSQRFSFNPSRDGKTFSPGKECDCSSSCAAIAKGGGFDVDMSDPIWTGNFAERLAAAGFQRLPFTGLSDLKPGDFLVGPGHVIYVRTDNLWWSAEQDENGRSSGGAGGDQNGREAYMRSPYNRSRGWVDVLRPPADAVSLTYSQPSWAPKPLDVDGVAGPLTYKRLQSFLGVEQTGVFDVVTRYKLQSYMGLIPGGWGPISTKALQRMVGAYPDGDWGPKTNRALQSWLNGQTLDYIARLQKGRTL